MVMEASFIPVDTFNVTDISGVDKEEPDKEYVDGDSDMEFVNGVDSDTELVTGVDSDTELVTGVDSDNMLVTDKVLLDFPFLASPLVSKISSLGGGMRVLFCEELVREMQISPTASLEQERLYLAMLRVGEMEDQLPP